MRAHQPAVDPQRGGVLVGRSLRVAALQRDIAHAQQHLGRAAIGQLERALLGGLGRVELAAPQVGLGQAVVQPGQLGVRVGHIGLVGRRRPSPKRLDCPLVGRGGLIVLAVLQQNIADPLQLGRVVGAGAQRHLVLLAGLDRLAARGI